MAKKCSQQTTFSLQPAPYLRVINPHGLDLPGVITSDEILDGADHLYQSMVIIGGGVIGVELATFYNDLGCEVTIVEGLDRLLPNMDKDLGQISV